VPGLAGKARRTARLAEARANVGMALGGEAGPRLSRWLATPVSGDTVLRLVRRRPLPPCPPPRVLGIDDWAWLRGRRYGTVTCDLERRRVVLPGRSAAPVREWLAARPGAAVVSRDRAGPCAEAARAGAPCAVQSADRWRSTERRCGCSTPTERAGARSGSTRCGVLAAAWWVAAPGTTLSRPDAGTTGLSGGFSATFRPPRSSGSPAPLSATGRPGRR
jgi:transposase